ncbi:hypothetical protein HDV00_008323 [Rhizophlyctis rosea]|nr:hypothetical protein HDV00_008323 [Rhizophlyctis rosea]
MTEEGATKAILTTPTHQDTAILITEKEIVTCTMEQEEAKLQLQSGTDSAAAETTSTRETWESIENRLKGEGKTKMRSHIQSLIGKTAVYSGWIGEKLKDHRQKQAEEKKERERSSAAAVRAKQTVLVDSALEPPHEPTRRSKRANAAVADDQAGKSKPAKKRKMTPKDENSGKRAKREVDVQPTYAPMEGERVGRQPRLVTGGTMREYQLVGMEWLISLYDNGLNGILADEMGLGKTLQCIAFLAHLHEMGTRGPFLIVAPLSTLANWVSEIERFTPQIPVILYHGSKQEREHLRRSRMRVGQNFPVIVTSYEICMNDRNYLQNYAWKFIIVDEGHRIKNLNCRLVRELKSYPSANRLLLTGTPLQNNLSELWSLLNFIMPDIFDDLTAFQEWFEFAEKIDDLNDEEGQSKLIDRASRTSFVSDLHNILKPFLLRRTKDEVELELPKKREYLIHAPLVPKQRLLYEAAIKGQLREQIVSLMMESSNEEGMGAENDAPESDGRDEAQASAEDEDPTARRASVRSVPRKDYKELSDTKYFKKLNAPDSPATSSTVSPMDIEARTKAAQKAIGGQKLQHLIAQLRKICNHPYLFDLGADDELEAEVPSHAHVGSDMLSTSRAPLPNIVTWSGKMLVLERLLPALFERGHKVLIFSQMTKVLDIVEDWCTVVKGWPACRLDGGVKIEERRRQIQDFNTNSDVKLFLLSTRAGGLGINLTAADTVIIFDSDWNPQADLQAQDRAHRIGQTRPVIIYRLVTANTVESTILSKASAKRRLEKLVIHKNHFKGGKDYYSQKSAALTLQDLAALLAADESERIESGGGGRGEGGELDPNSKMYLPENILSDADLERILDRSDAAYERKDGSEGSRFQIVEEDDGGDLLGGVNDGSGVGV